jgi:hypothetical protein
MVASGAESSPLVPPPDATCGVPSARACLHSVQKLEPHDLPWRTDPAAFIAAAPWR